MVLFSCFFWTLLLKDKCIPANQMGRSEMEYTEKEDYMVFKKLLAVTAAAAMSLTAVFGFGVTPVKKASAAAFVDMNQSQIVKVMGAGWNLGNQLEASIGGMPNETCWGNPTISENMIKAVRNAGFSSIRVPVSYLGKIGGGSSYTIDASWLNRVKQVVDMCIKYDLYVIINMHGDGYNSVQGSWLLCNGSDQATIRAKYAACWKQIANCFKDYDHHLIFESMNEEFDGTYGTPNRTYYSNINKLNQIFVDTVRKTGGNNAKRWLLVPGWNTNIEYTAGNYGFSVPTDNYRSSAIPSGEKRIMISVHYYDPWGFCGEESGVSTQWGSKATNSGKVDSYGDESYMRSMFAKMQSVFTNAGYPVVLGEYGAIDKSADDSRNAVCRADFAEKVCKYAKQYGHVPIWWDNGVTAKYGFGLFNRYTCKVTQQSIINAIMSVYPSTVLDTSKTYMIKNAHSGLYMDAAGAKAVNGTNVLQYSASRAKANNTWKLVPDGKGCYYIYSVMAGGSTFLLDVANNSGANGANIGIWQNTNCNAQRYKLFRNADGSYNIFTMSSNGNSCIEVINALTTNNGNIQQWGYNGHNCQKWNLIPQ